MDKDKRTIKQGKTKLTVIDQNFYLDNNAIPSVYTSGLTLSLFPSCNLFQNQQIHRKEVENGLATSSEENLTSPRQLSSGRQKA